MKIDMPKDLVEFFKSLGIKAKPMGKDVFIPCPWHRETEPSLSVRKSDGIWNCFGCGKSGNFIDILSHYGVGYQELISTVDAISNDEFAEIVENLLSEDFRKEVKQVSSKYHRRHYGDFKLLHKNKKLYKYFVGKRGFGEETVRNLMIGYTDIDWVNGKVNKFYNRVLIPVYDHKGKFAWMEGRRIDKKKKMKYVRPPYSQAGDVFYNFHRFIEEDTVVIVEGILDAMRLWEWGVNGIANFGTRVSDYKINLLSAFNKVVMCFDGDEVGQISQMDLIPRMVGNGYDIQSITMPPDKDICDITIEEYAKLADRITCW